MAAVRLSFMWLGTRKTLLPEQRDTAARAFHADRELLSASKLILDTKNPAYRAVAAVRSEASGYWRTVTLPFPEAGVRLLPQNSLGLFAQTMQTYRERLQEAARELASQYDTIKSEAQRRLGSLYNASDYALNFANCPTIAYSGEIDRQKQAADVMEREMNKEGLDLLHLIGPKTAHKLHPDSLVEIEHPDIAVLSFQELAPEVNVQPVGRIAVG